MKRRIHNEIKKFTRDLVTGDAEANVSECLAWTGFSVSSLTADHFKHIALKLCGDEATLDQFASVIPAFLNAPHSENALLNLLRYIENLSEPRVFLDTMARGKPIQDILSTTFGTSQYMSDIIVRNPGIIYWLIEKHAWEEEETVSEYEAIFQDAAVRFISLDGKLNAIKRTHRRMLLKIGVHDLLGQASVEQTARRLSDLADAVVRVVLAVVWRNLMIESPIETSGPGEAAVRSADGGETEGFAVLALGKLGGCELNYSSDIDLIYVCKDVDDDTATFYRLLAEKLTAALSDITDEGYLYRVDLRLRPDGMTGPIVNTLASMQLYYQNRGKPWEFQAHLKSRVIAGDEALGNTLLETITNLITNPSSPYSPLEDIALMRIRIQESISPEDRSFNIKLMEGGIRDIEFIVQTLQLLHGAGHPDILETNTLASIELIQKHSWLKKWEAKTLSSAYRFFRLVEHRLQMMHQIKTHSIPQSEVDIELLARRVSAGPLGAYSKDQFLEALTTHLNKVRMMSDSFFSETPIDETALLLVLPQSDAMTTAMLERYGLDDPLQAIKVIHSMAFGSFPRLLDRKTRSALEALLPLLLDDVSRTGDPSLSLTNTARIAAASMSESTFYRLLTENEGMRKLVVALAGLSSPLSTTLCTHPEITDSVMEDPEGFLLEHLDKPVFSEEDARIFREGLAGRNGSGLDRLTRKVKNRLSFLELAALLIDTSDRTLPRRLPGMLSSFARSALSQAFDIVTSEKDAALLVMGSFGVGEPRLRSDIDLLVVSGAGGVESVETLTREIHTLNRFFSGAGVFTLDFRLRGEGASAPLIQDAAYYRKYFEGRISPWEKIAFSKCSAWSGSGECAHAFLGELAALLSKPFSESDIGSLMDIRRKMENSVTGHARFWDTKNAAGGRYDIDYICGVGMSLIAHESEYPFSMKTPERIGLLEEKKLITEEDARACREALRLYAKLETVMELQGFSVPRSEARSQVLSRYIDRTFSFLDAFPGTDEDGSLLDRNHPPEPSIEESLTACKQRVRRCYDAFFGSLS